MMQIRTMRSIVIMKGALVALCALFMLFAVRSTAVMAYDLYELDNLITNGDFSIDTDGNGLADGWTNANSATYAIIDGKQKFGWVAGSYYGGITNVTMISGHKYYFSAYWYQNSVPDKYYIQGYNGSINYTIFDSVDFPGSMILTMANNSSQMKFYQDAYCGTGDYMLLDNVMLFDLTAQFGSGFEPSLTDFELLYLPDLDYFDSYSSFYPESYTAINSGDYADLGDDLTGIDFSKSVISTYGENITIDMYAYFYDSDNYTGIQNALYYSYNNHPVVKYGSRTSTLDWGSSETQASGRVLRLIMDDVDEQLLLRALFDRNINTENYLSIDIQGRNTDDVSFYFVLSSSFDLRVDISSFLISYEFDVHENDFTVIEEMIIKCYDRNDDMMLPALKASMDDSRTFVIDDIGSQYTDVSAFNFEFHLVSPYGDDDSPIQTLYLYELGVFSSSDVVFGDAETEIPLPFPPGVCDWYELGCQAKNTVNEFWAWFYEKASIGEIVDSFDTLFTTVETVVSSMPSALTVVITTLIGALSAIAIIVIVDRMTGKG